jgi:hemolysin III
MLPLADIFFTFGNAGHDSNNASSSSSSSSSSSLLDHVQCLDFNLAPMGGMPLIPRIRGLRSHGAVSVANIIAHSNSLTEVRLNRNKIGSYGAAAIASSFQQNTSVRKLEMRSCAIGEKGAFAFSRDALVTPNALEFLDLSINNIGHAGVVSLAEALKLREDNGMSGIEVDMEGNLVLQEVLNSVTHGIGILLCIIGTYLLTERAGPYSPMIKRSCYMYSASLITLYTSSTLYHSFFGLRTTKAVFSVFDHCAIYMLIAGTYTPMLCITFPDMPKYNTFMLGFLWVCTFFGMLIEAFCQKAKWKSKVSLTLYLGMGWAALVALPDLNDRLTTQTLVWLFLGGVGYTAGVPFFVRNNNLDHALWHLFVMAGSIAHWYCVYEHVLPLAEGIEKRFGVE